jgi:hypothetical protein
VIRTLIVGPALECWSVGSLLSGNEYGMYLFTFIAKVSRNLREAERFAELGGAYVNCWINFKDYEAAEKLAKLLIRDAGWIPAKKLKAAGVRKKWCKKKSEQRCYSEAMQYGYTLVFNMWPKDAPDADAEHDAEEE